MTHPDTDSKNERWKPVPEYDGLYEVSDQGRVRSKPRLGTDGRVLSPQKRKDGYRLVRLSKNGEKETKYVHRIVLRAFEGPPPDGHEASHLNGDRSDNRLENLTWETSSQNHQRKSEHGTAVGAYPGEDHHNCQYPDAIVRQVRERYAGGDVTQKELASEIGCSRSTITEWVNGDKRRTAGGPF